MAVGSTKKCTKCKEDQPTRNFRPCKRSKDGLDYWCNRCNRNKNKKWLHNSEKGKEMKKRTSDKNKKKRREDPSEERKHYKKWYDNNREAKIKSTAAYNKKKIKEDVQWRLRDRYRGRISQAIRSSTGKKKNTSTTELLGCSIQELKFHLESLFKLGMNWENYGSGIGKWSVDHIKPCSAYDLSDLNQQKQCFHYSNLQPLWFEENSSKGGFNRFK